jgi:hypothetical protein
MNFSSTLSRVFAYSIICTLFLSASFFSVSAFAGKPLITSSFSGIWDQPEQESQGIILQIGEQDEDKKVGIAYWFTYGPDLKTSWYLGVGPVVGNEIEMILYTASDIGFMAENLNNDEADEPVEPVGTLHLDFHNCNKGTATFEFDEVEGVIDSGEFPIKRISSIYRQRCSGGISDDTPSGGKPLQLEVRLHPAEEGGSGEGKAKFWERTDRSDFKVEVEDVADVADVDGYTIRICADNENPDVEEQQFPMSVFEGEGELEFRSPEIDEKLNLNFDPRGCKIELLEGNIVLLTTGDDVLSEKKTGKPDKDDDEGMELEAEFTNTGVIGYESANGEAEYEMEGDEREFSVKVKNAPAGFYTVEVIGEVKGELEVTEVDGKLEGRVKFTEPKKADTLLLDFDPLSQIIEILTVGDPQMVILEASFPSE